jgi:hypothetical protein
LWAASCRVEYELWDTASELRLHAGQLTVWGQGPDAAAAQLDATGRAAQRLSEELTSGSAARPPDTDGSLLYGGNIILVRQLTQAAPLVALKAALRTRTDVVADVVERWAAEGAIALAVELVEGRNGADLLEVLVDLGGRTDWGYTIDWLGDSPEALEIRLLPRPERPEGTPADSTLQPGL